ncbi:MAG: ubiquinol-cytochrome c reductase iron-sulfur subunit, partial [Stellaceae bacterium]
MAQPASTAAHDDEGGTRREFLSLAATAIGVVGACCAVWPLIDSMNPAEDVLAAGAPVDVDIKDLQPGQQMLVLWRSHPIFIAHRTPAELKTLQNPTENSELRDPNSEAMQQPA